MPNNLESHGIVYNHAGKGHDRLFLDDTNGLYAVFDGAGGDELSQAVMDQLPASIAARSAIRPQSQAEFLATVVADMDGLHERFLRKATAAMACVTEQAEAFSVHYFNGGDSSLYFYNKSTGSFRRIAHTPTEFIQQNGRQYTNTAEFLGAGRSVTQVLQSVGKLLLPKDIEWSIIGMSDGVQDDDGQGIATSELAAIVRNTKAADVPNQILASYPKYDDASVFIVQH
ncbi:MAG: hypothetical protein JWN38_504 [Candidatus Saccharibacteria bacterium]|nr:hypothetical protein [Candidatus Saccharibacteria bacterium]